MAIARTEDFSSKDQQLAEWCKALAHPARIEILRNLANRGKCICGELVVDLPLAQATVSQHIKALKDAGLIKGEISGPRSLYCVDKKNIAKLVKAFGDFGAKIMESGEEQSCR